MRIKVDENLPARIAKLLTERGHDADTVGGEGLIGADDQTVWQAAQNTGRFLITQDLDFSHIRRFRPGHHHGILLLRLGNPGRSALVEAARAILDTEDLESWHRCFVVATPRKVRIQRPEPS